MIFTGINVPTYKKQHQKDLTMASSLAKINTGANFYKYTNSCIIVKGNNPFVVSPLNHQPKFMRNHHLFNDRYRHEYIDKNGNMNDHWAKFLQGTLGKNSYVECCKCGKFQASQSDVIQPELVPEGWTLNFLN